MIQDFGAAVAVKISVANIHFATGLSNPRFKSPRHGISIFIPTGITEL
jgi:hypothetical protein